MASVVRAGAPLLLATAGAASKTARQIDGDAPEVHCHPIGDGQTAPKTAGDLGKVSPPPSKPDGAVV